MVPLQGYASSISHPFDLDDDEIDDWRYEREEALARRKPLGFAPWPEEG